MDLLWNLEISVVILYTPGKKSKKAFLQIWEKTFKKREAWHHPGKNYDMNKTWWFLIFSVEENLSGHMIYLHFLFYILVLYCQSKYIFKHFSEIFLEISSKFAWPYFNPFDRSVVWKLMLADKHQMTFFPLKHENASCETLCILLYY